MREASLCLRLVPEEALDSDEFRVGVENLATGSRFVDSGLTWEWLRVWWACFRDYGAGSKEVVNLCGYMDRELVAWFPLCMRRLGGLRVIEMMGASGGATTDYTGPLIRAGLETVAVNALLAHLGSAAHGWHVAIFDLPSGLPHPLGGIRDVARSHGLRSQESTIGEHLTVDLPSDFEGYLASLGRKTRQDVRQYLRQYRDLGLSLEIVTGTRSSGDIRQFIALSRQSWPYFEDAAIAEFFTRYWTSCATQRDFTATLRDETGILAAVTGFLHGPSCLLHTACVDRGRPASMSPGTLLHAVLFRELTSRGVRLVDLSPGAEPYKRRLGGRPHPLRRAVIAPSRLWLRALSVLQFARRSTRGGRELLRARPTRGESSNGRGGA